MAKPFLLVYDGTTRKLFNVDTHISQSHSFSVRVTEFPVEQNVTYIDNATPQPFRVGVVLASGNVTPTGEEGPFRQANLWNELIELASALKGYEIITHYGKYTSMVITEISTDSDVATGEGIIAKVQFTQIRQTVRGAEGFELLDPNEYRGRIALTERQIAVG